MNLFVFGLGYSAMRYVDSARADLSGVAGTARSPAKAAQLATRGVAGQVFDGRHEDEATRRALLSCDALLVSIPALMTPVIIIGGKIFGWFTATESAAIAVLYAGTLSIVVYREMKLKGLYTALLDTGKLAAVALFCVGTASTFG